jgi:hypothetical protein
MEKEGRLAMMCKDGQERLTHRRDAIEKKSSDDLMAARL